MRRFFGVVSIIIPLLLVGCKGATDAEIREFKTSGKAMVLTKGSRWVEDIYHIKYLSRVYRIELDTSGGAGRYYFVVDKDTRVLMVNDSETGEYPRILFEEGKYRNKTGFTVKQFLKTLPKN